MSDARVLNGDMTNSATTTHEQFVHLVRNLVVADALERGTIDKDQAETLAHAKLIYGVGQPGIRGVCYHEAWENGIGKVACVEISALTEESWVQLAGTTLHELAHVLRGMGFGHDVDWKLICVKLGFTYKPEAAGQRYFLAMFRPELRMAICRAAAAVRDGNPSFHWAAAGSSVKVRPCSHGVGARGGKSRGTGSGSRLRLWECECIPKPVKVRVASDSFNATCDDCGAKFERKS
jgi:hypothetical protein